MADTLAPLTPRGYQVTDARLAQEMERCMLLHEFGTGKSLISTMALEGHWPGVVLCRSHLVVQWVRHLERQYPGAKIGAVAVRAPRGGWREATRDEKVAMLTDRSYEWRVLTYATARRNKPSREANHAGGIRSLRETWRDVAEEKGWMPERAPRRKVPPFEYPLPPLKGLILDESHICRRRGSQQFKGAYQLAVPTKARKAAEFVLELTATPVLREADDLFAQLRLLDPHRISSYWNFIDRYCLLDETEYGSKVVGGRTKAIRKLLSRYAIQRGYDDPEVALAVPRVIPREVWSYMTPGSVLSYDRVLTRLENDRKAGMPSGSGVAELSKITAHDKNKLADLDATIESLHGEPFALFCWYHDTVDLVAKRYGLKTFKGSSGNRYTRADDIIEAGSFVASIGCIQEGTNLSHLRFMMFYEVDYTWGSMEQVRRRLARWRPDSSTDPVVAFYVLSAGTVDETSLEASMGRGATADQILKLELER